MERLVNLEKTLIAKYSIIDSGATIKLHWSLGHSAESDLESHTH